jgi:predicted ester cyclase
MPDFAAAADRLVAAYNSKDFKAFRSMITPTLDFAHFNRNFSFDRLDGLMESIEQFASTYIPDRRFEPPLRVTVAGNVVVRESYYVGTAKVDLPGFAQAGGQVRLKFCTVFRFDDQGILVEWKDYG